MSVATPVSPVRDLGRLPDARRSLITLETFKRLIRPDQKADLIEGVMVMASPASPKHEMLLAFLLRLIGNFVETQDLGVVMGSRALVDISAHHGYEPDLLFIRRERRDIIGPESITAAPDLVVEIISPGSRRYDAYVKKDGYARIGVAEYWLLDPDNKQAAFYQLFEGYYAEIAPDENGAFQSTALPGLAIRPEWLWPDEEGNFEKVAALLQKMTGFQEVPCEL